MDPLPRCPNLNRLASLPIDVLNQLFATCLVHAVQHNDHLGTRGAITRFHSKQPPPLEITDYLTRLTKYTPFPRDALLLGILYLNRISHLPYTAESGVQPLALLPQVAPWRSSSSSRRRRPPPPAVPPTSPLSTPNRNLAPPTSPLQASAPIPPSPTISSVLPPAATPILNSYTLHRLVLAVLLIATKFSCDGMLSQPRAAKVGGVAVSELAKLEGEVIRLLGWRLYWEEVEMELTCKELVRIAEKKGLIEPLSEDEGTPQPEQGFSPPPPAASDDPLAFASPPRPTIFTAPSFASSTSPATATLSSATTTDYSASSSSASSSQPSSSASSPRLSLFSPTSSLRGKSRQSYFTAGDDPREEDGEGEGVEVEVTPPSSPSATSVEGGSSGEGSGFTIKADEEGGGKEREGLGLKHLGSKGSDETVRRLEGVSLQD